LVVCTNCDHMLNTFYQFRIDSVNAQHEFAAIIQSLHPTHFDTSFVEYYSPDMEPIRPIDENMYVNVENIYSSTPAPPTIQSSHSYDNQCSYIEHDFQLALDDVNQTDNQSLATLPHSSIMDQTVHRPHISPLSPSANSILVQPPQQQMTPQPLNSENCYKEAPASDVIQYGQEPLIQPENNYFESLPQEDNDSFTYDDFDETCQSVPSDRNNVDNAIDKKIEEFIQNKGNKANPKICTVCNKLFRTNYKLRVHMETHAENNAKFICGFENCNKAFKSKIGLREHAAKHTGEYKFTCKDCDKKFLLRSYFVAHQRIHFNAKQKKFPCSLCSKTFKSKQNLIDHENCHLGLKFFKCEICEKSYTTKTHLDIHLKSHNQIDRFMCTVCNKFFKSKNYLKTHIKTHFDELKNYSCGYCGKKFIQMSDLKIHTRIHTNERSFVCET
jgi:Zinc finger, C2H2 type/C2H2-type zinc finger/Zinc-finger of C2H2 type